METKYYQNIILKTRVKDMKKVLLTHFCEFCKFLDMLISNILNNMLGAIEKFHVKETGGGRYENPKNWLTLLSNFP